MFYVKWGPSGGPRPPWNSLPRYTFDEDHFWLYGSWSVHNCTDSSHCRTENLSAGCVQRGLYMGPEVRKAVCFCGEMPHCDDRRDKRPHQEVEGRWRALTFCFQVRHLQCLFFCLFVFFFFKTTMVFFSFFFLFFFFLKIKSRL